jgi:hypothetical protein
MAGELREEHRVGVKRESVPAMAVREKSRGVLGCWGGASSCARKASGSELMGKETNEKREKGEDGKTCC